MAEISAKLEKDVNDLLFEGAQKSRYFKPTREQKKIFKAKRREVRKEAIRSKKTLRMSEKAFLKALKKEDKLNRKARKAATKASKATTDADASEEEEEKRVKLTASEIWLLRKLVGTRRRIRDLRPQTPLIKKIRSDDEDDFDSDAGTRNGKTIKGKEVKDKKARHRNRKHDDTESHRKEYGETKIEVTPRARSVLNTRPWLGRGRVLPTRPGTVHPVVSEMPEEVLSQ